MHEGLLRELEHAIVGCGKWPFVDGIGQIFLSMVSFAQGLFRVLFTRTAFQAPKLALYEEFSRSWKNSSDTLQRVARNPRVKELLDEVLLFVVLSLLAALGCVWQGGPPLFCFLLIRVAFRPHKGAVFAHSTFVNASQQDSHLRTTFGGTYYRRMHLYRYRSSALARLTDCVDERAALNSWNP
jgi:hypothetical protein